MRYISRSRYTQIHGPDPDQVQSLDLRWTSLLPLHTAYTPSPLLMSSPHVQFVPIHTFKSR